MKRLFSILFLFYWVSSLGQGNNSFFTFKNYLFSSREEKLGDNLSDSTANLSFVPRLVYVNVNSQKDNFSTFLYGAAITGNIKNKFNLIGFVDKISGRYNSYLQQI